MARCGDAARLVGDGMYRAQSDALCRCGAGAGRDVRGPVLPRQWRGDGQVCGGFVGRSGAGGTALPSLADGNAAPLGKVRTGTLSAGYHAVCISGICTV